jgi:hypothetical protein
MPFRLFFYYCYVVVNPIEMPLIYEFTSAYSHPLSYASTNSYCLGNAISHYDMRLKAVHIIKNPEHRSLFDRAFHQHDDLPGPRVVLVADREYPESVTLLLPVS